MVVKISEYTVCAIPEDLDISASDRRMWALYVRPTFMEDKWVVTDASQAVITKTGKRTHSLPRGFRRNHYLPLSEALDLAERTAASMPIYRWANVEAFIAEVRSKP